MVGWEPSQALFAAGQGLEVIATLLAEAAEHLLPAGAIIMEIGAGQGETVRELARQAPGLGRVEIRPDLAGRDRIIVAERA